MRCDDCSKDVHQRFALNVEIDGMEEDGSPWTEFKERMLCSQCYKQRLDATPKPGVFTKQVLKQLDIDEDKFVQESGINWDKDSLLKLVEKDVPEDGKPKLKQQFSHLKKQNA